MHAVTDQQRCLARVPLPGSNPCGFACLLISNPGLQATGFTSAEWNLAKDLDSKVTAKSYCSDPVRTVRANSRDYAKLAAGAVPQHCHTKILKYITTK